MQWRRVSRRGFQAGVSQEPTRSRTVAFLARSHADLFVCFASVASPVKKPSPQQQSSFVAVSCCCCHVPSQVAAPTCTCVPSQLLVSRCQAWPSRRQPASSCWPAPLTAGMPQGSCQAWRTMAGVCVCGRAGSCRVCIYTLTGRGILPNRLHSCALLFNLLCSSSSVSVSLFVHMCVCVCCCLLVSPRPIHIMQACADPWGRA